jgi:hypothetical protein
MWGLWCLMPLSTIFQLFHGSYSDWWQYIYVVLEIVCLKILLLFSPKILHMPPDQDFDINNNLIEQSQETVNKASDCSLCEALIWCQSL